MILPIIIINLTSKIANLKRIISYWHPINFMAGRLTNVSFRKDPRAAICKTDFARVLTKTRVGFLALTLAVLMIPQSVTRSKICFSDPYWTLGQLGTASWYGEPFHGRMAANGEVYDMHQLTAAHRTLPLGTRIRVTNMRNQRSILLRVNDRGPYTPGRILDVSYEAASQLHFVQGGTTPVKTELVSFPKRYKGHWPAPLPVTRDLRLKVGLPAR